MVPQLDGLLLVDKPPGKTSHDIVDFVRRRFDQRKVGHCGTLDPIATGLLMLVVGKATRVQDLLMAEDKEYEGTLKLGETIKSPVINKSCMTRNQPIIHGETACRR